jgi:DNA-binding YbaB/EbfC family protein
MKGGMQQLLKQANQMQARMKKVQEELAGRNYEGTSGGGAVKVTIKGDSEIVAVAITEDVMKSGDTEMLQDLIVTATNEALKTAKTTQAAEMEKVTGGMNLPGMF